MPLAILLFGISADLAAGPRSPQQVALSVRYPGPSIVYCANRWLLACGSPRGYPAMRVIWLFDGKSNCSLAMVKDPDAAAAVP